MNNGNFIWSYVQMCSAGKLPLSDCGPVWQIGIIAAILVCAIVFLIVLRIQAHPNSAQRE